MSLPAQCKAIIDIAFDSETVWNRIEGILNLETFDLSCTVTSTPDQRWAMMFERNRISISELVIEYNEQWCNAVDINKVAYLAHCSGFSVEDPPEREMDLQFHFKKNELKLRKPEPFTSQQLIFVGMRKNGVSSEVMYNGEKICVKGEKHDDILRVESEGPLSEDIEHLVYMAFSIYQNGKLTLHAKYDNEFIFLYPAKREISGIDVHFGIWPFNVLWNWLLKDDLYKKWLYCIEFFFAGMQKSGSYIDFRLMNLFVFINAVISIDRVEGSKEQFGAEIASLLDISEGDGYWLAYVRNALVHDGAAIPHAIEKANDEFLKKQTKQGKKLVRYKNFELPTEHPNDRAFLLYCDIMDLTEAFIMRSAGYTDKWLEIKKRFGLTI